MLNVQRQLLIFFIAVFSMFSCKQSTALKRPYNDENRVVNLLVDMHFAAEGAKVDRKNNIDSLNSVYTKQVLTIHDISEEKYQAIVKYLESDLDAYYAVEQKVHKKLKEVQGK